MCNIIKFDKNFKADKSDDVVKYLFICGESVRWYDCLSEEDALSILRDTTAIYPKTKMYKCVTDKTGKNERVFPLVLAKS